MTIAEKTKGKTEWISGAEAIKRLDSSKVVLGTMARNKQLTFKQDPKTKQKKYLYKWPIIKEEYAAAQEKKRKTIAASEPRKRFDINADEYKDMSVGERVILAVEQGSRNGPDLAYNYAKSITELVKSRLASIKLLEAEGKTLTKAEVENFIFTTSRQNRDVWLNWPERIAIKMGEELGIDTKLCHDVLKKYVRLQLERNATMPVSIAGAMPDYVPEGAATSSRSDS